VREAHQRVHEGKLPRVIELEARDALSGRGDCWFRKLSELAAINKGLQDVLLHVEIVVVDGRHGLAEDGRVFHRFVDPVIIDIVACRFCAQDEVIARNATVIMVAFRCVVVTAPAYVAPRPTLI
jgi:hypothetical protein